MPDVGAGKATLRDTRLSPCHCVPQGRKTCVYGYAGLRGALWASVCTCLVAGAEGAELNPKPQTVSSASVKALVLAGGVDARRGDAIPASHPVT